MLWFLWIVPILAFDPTLSGFRISLLLDNVPEKVVGNWDRSDLRLLNYIHYSPKFIKNFEQFKYILNTNEQEFNALNKEMYTDNDHWIKQKIHQWKAKFDYQVSLVQQLLRRHHIYTIYLVENKLHSYVMLIDLRANYKINELLLWITNYQSPRLVKGESWCAGIDTFTEVKFVKVGEAIGQCKHGRIVAETVKHERKDEVKDEL